MENQVFQTMIHYKELFSTLPIIITVITIQRNVEVHGFSPIFRFDGLKNYTIVSVWSICSDLTAQERSEFNVKAAQEKVDFDGLTTDQFYDLNYLSVDVCESNEALLHTLVNVSLNSNFYFASHAAPDEHVINKDMNILFLIGYVTEIQSKLITETMAFTEFQKYCFPVKCDDLLSIPSNEENSLALLDFVDYFGWKNIKMVSVTDELVYPHHLYFVESLRIFNETQRFCIQTKVLNLTELYPNRDMKQSYQMDLDWYHEYVVDFLGDDNSLLMFFGNYHFTSNVPFEYNETDSVCIVHDTELFYGDEIKRFFNVITITDAFNRQSQTRYTDNNEYEIYLALHDFIHDLSAERGFSAHRSEYESLVIWRKNINDLFQTRYTLPLSTKNPLPYGLRIKHEQARNLTQTFLKEHKNSYPSLQCRQLNCPPGYEKKYGQQTINNNNKNLNDSGGKELSFGMKCDLCPIKHIKTWYGDGPCVACTGVLSTDNGYRTKCVDPYTNYDLKMDSTMAPITCTLGVIGACFTLAVMVVFYIRRETSTVRSSDYHLSLVHLSSIVIAYIIGLLSSFAGLSDEMCVLRNLNISIFYCLNAACIYTKSEKLLSAFTSRVRVTADEINKKIATQVFTIVILLVTANTLLYVSYSVRKPKIEFWQDSEKWQRIHYCNTTFHQTLLFSYSTILQLVCSVQAFRGRNLPGPMNDAMAMVYSILISTATFTVSFPIGYFRGQRDVESLQLLVIFINLFCFVFFLYGTKCFVIIFQPQKNTREYFNKNTLEAMLANAKQKRR